MRSAPAYSLDIPVQRGWAWAVGLLVLTSAATGLAWWWLPEQDLLPALRFGLAAAALATVGLAVRVSATAGGKRLRWDGADWWFGRPGCIPEQMEAGRLRVMMDLSAFMLLRFEPLAAAASPRARWIALQRHGLDAQWHPLRCAVYSARSEIGPFTSGDQPRPASPRPLSHE